MFSTADDNQPAVTIHVLQGERKQATQNKSLGQFDLADIPPAPRGVPQVEVSFDLDANGILNVSAKDKATGKEQSIVIKASSGLSDEEVEQMVRDAESHAEEDRRFEDLVTARNHADGMVHATKKMLEEAGDKADANEKAAIETAIAALEEAIKTEDKATIETRTQELAEASSSLTQKMYEEAQAGAAQTAEEPATANAGGDPDAVDAEFEEVQDEKK